MTEVERFSLISIVHGATFVLCMPVLYAMIQGVLIRKLTAKKAKAEISRERPLFNHSRSRKDLGSDVVVMKEAKAGDRI